MVTASILVLGSCSERKPAISVTSVMLNKTSIGLLVGADETLTATVSPETATDKNVIWSSDKTDIATVDASGKVTGVKEGMATITVTTKDGGKTATCAVSVSAKVVPVTGVSLNKDATTILVGGDETLTAIIAPENATNKNVTFSSDKTDIATVDASSGKVTGVKAGEATITVTTEDGGKKASCTVTVSNIAVTGVTLDKTTLPLYVGASETLTTTITPENATNKNVRFSSDKADIATVDASGKVTGVKEGTATITVTTEDGGKTAHCAVTVKEDVPEFPDPAFLDYLLNNTAINTNEDDKITYAEVEAFRGEINVRGNQAIKSLQGIEFFVNITKLDCRQSGVTSLDLSRNTELSEINAYMCRSLTSLDISKNRKLMNLNVSVCGELALLDLSSATTLKTLGLEEFEGSIVWPVGGFPELTILNALESNIKTLPIAPKLKEIDVLDASGLESINCANYPDVTFIQVNNVALNNFDTGWTKLETCWIDDWKVTSADFSNKPVMEEIYIESAGALTKIYLKSGQTIEYLDIPESIEVDYK